MKYLVLFEAGTADEDFNIYEGPFTQEELAAYFKKVPNCNGRVFELGKRCVIEVQTTVKINF